MENTTGTSQLPSSIDLLKGAKDLVSKRAAFFMAIVGIPGAAMFAGMLVPVLGIILMPVAVVLYLFASVALIKAFDQESMTDWKAAYASAKGLVLSYLWVGILVGIVVNLATLLLVLPGIYLSIVYTFYGFAVVLEGKKGWDAAKRSGELVKGNWWAVFGRIILTSLIVMIPYVVISALAGMIDERIVLPVVNFVLMLFVIPLMVGVQYLMYRHLKQMPKVVVTSATPVQPQM
jgi:hypothetical protein